MVNLTMPSSFLIDQRSASFIPAPNDVRVWASGRRVFISSLIADMPSERAAVRAAIEEVGAVPVMFEDLGAQDVSAEQAYLAGVRSSDIYVGLWGPRYGVRMADGYSATHAEFLEAERQGLRLCLFVCGEASGEMDGAQRDLIQGARNLYTTSPWTTPEDLQARMVRRLTELAADDLAPWVRIGRIFVRAHEITNDGQTITVAAEVRSAQVHAELVRLRDMHATDLPFVSPGEARSVRLEGLSTRTVSTAAHEERVVLRGRDRTPFAMRMSVNGVDADEMTRRALSDGLFGTTTLGQSVWGVQSVDPLAQLREMSLDDVVLRPVARLLLTEHLLSTGATTTVNAFALGPAHNGVRRLRLTWTPRSAYAYEPDPEPLTLDGKIRNL